jgi:dienelactone hydrolase
LGASSLRWSKLRDVDAHAAIPFASNKQGEFKCKSRDLPMSRSTRAFLWSVVFFIVQSLSAVATNAQLKEYKTTDSPKPGENIAEPCDYEATFPAGTRAVKAAWVTYDRGPDIKRFYSDPDVVAFAERNDLAMVLAHQCAASKPPTGEAGEMDMNPEHGLGRSLFSALTAIGAQSAHPELGQSKLILLGFSGTGAYFGHFLAYAPDRVLAAILANPGQTEPENVDNVRLDARGTAVPVLIVVGGKDAIAGTSKPYTFFKHYYSDGAPWIYLVQNGIPHCCVIDTKPFILDWLREVIEIRQPEPGKAMLPFDQKNGWHGSIRPCNQSTNDHWGLPLLSVCDARINRTELRRSSDMSSGYFPSESLAKEWLAYVKQTAHPRNSFPRPDDPNFGEPK